MKTATVRDLRYDFPKIEAWLRNGEEIQITKHNKPLATLTRPKPSGKNSAPKFDLEEHRAWRKRVWKGRVFTQTEVEEMRTFETGEP